MAIYIYISHNIFNISLLKHGWFNHGYCFHMGRLGWFQNIVRWLEDWGWTKWFRFVMTGVPPVVIIHWWDFPWNKPTIFGVSPFCFGSPKKNGRGPSGSSVPCRGLGAEVAESEQMLEDVRRTHDVPCPGMVSEDPRWINGDFTKHNSIPLIFTPYLWSLEQV